MRTLSLCSGVGVLDMVAADLFGARPLAFADPDPDASAVLADRWPGVPNVRYVESVNYIPNTRWPADVVTAGWPCQPWSLNGQQLGELDPRAIWPSVRSVIDRTRPRVVMLENVANVCRTGELARVVADLADLGFDAEWTVYRACCSGAPHQRARLFLLAAHPERGGLPARIERSESSGAPGDARIGWADALGGAVRVADLGRGWAHHAPAIARWEAVTGREAPAPRVNGRRQGPFWAWLMGLPAGHLDAVERHPAQIKLAGNSIVRQAADAAFRELVERFDA